MSFHIVEKDEVQLVYISERAANSSDEVIEQIKRYAEHANHKLDITGALLFSPRYFLQFLEGEAAAVDALYHKISQDPRHHKVRLLQRKPITVREFSRWRLGVKKLLDNDEYQDLIALLNMLGQAETVTEQQLNWFKLVVK